MTPKPIWRSRTMWLAAAVLAGVEAAQFAGWIETLSPHWIAVYAAAVAVLRFVTIQPVSWRGRHGLLALLLVPLLSGCETFREYW